MAFIRTKRLSAGRCLRIATWLWLVLISTSGLSAQDDKPTGTRNTFWSVGLANNRHLYKAADGNELLGSSNVFSVGGGYIGDNWYSFGQFDILMGPHERTRDSQVQADYFGTGITYWWGYSAQTLNIRSEDGGYGFALGVSYADIVGNSLSRQYLTSVGETKSTGPAYIDRYEMRVTNLSLVPALFFSWLKEARPKGNDPDYLATRIEGYLLTIGFATPLITNYHTEFEQPSSKGPGLEKITERGKFTGYSIIISLSTFLGI